jgi:hypothetical protein
MPRMRPQVDLTGELDSSYPTAGLAYNVQAFNPHTNRAQFDVQEASIPLSGFRARNFNDNITKMLDQAFVTPEYTACRGESLLLTKMGVKIPLPGVYSGSKDVEEFENWLAKLIGWFQMHQLDVLVPEMNIVRVQLLSQSLDGKAITYYHHQIDDYWYSNKYWDFQDAILDLRDRFLHKSTALTAVHKFDSLNQGNKDVRGLFEALQNEANRMIEPPGDYTFRKRETKINECCSSSQCLMAVQLLIS